LAIRRSVAETSFTFTQGFMPIRDSHGTVEVIFTIPECRPIPPYCTISNWVFGPVGMCPYIRERRRKFILIDV